MTVPSGRVGRISGATGAPAVPRTLALWGDRGSGKSGVIGALRSEGTKSIGERWTVDLEGAHADVLELADSASLALRLRDVKATAIRRPERAVTLVAKRYAGARVTDAVDLALLDPEGAMGGRPAAPEAREVI